VPPGVERDSGQLLDGRYRLLECIGKGGMGSVYLAEHVLLRRKVAIKTLHSNFADSAEHVARFRREAQVAAALQSEYVVTVMDMGRLKSGEYYLVLEHLRGADLAWLIANQGPFSIERSLRMALRLCAAMDAVHHLDVIHRDIKPQNVFVVAGSDASESLKLLDFGICKAPSFDAPGAAALTRTGTWLGSPHYMAPEQVEGRAGVDQRTDVYAAGAVLHFMLTGRPPFDATTLLRLLVQICDAPNPDLTVDPTHVPAGLQCVLDRALAKRPQDRYQTARELHGAIAALTP
jgi:serine/threonine-protein kinase